MSTSIFYKTEHGKVKKRQRKETKEQNEELQGAVNFLYKALFAIGNYVGEKSLQSVVQEMNTLFVKLENVLK